MADPFDAKVVAAGLDSRNSSPSLAKDTALSPSGSEIAYNDDSSFRLKNDHPGRKLTLKEINERNQALADKYGVNRNRLQWYVDCWIVLPICLLYLLAFLDRVNISNANVYGLSQDIHLKPDSNQYNVALAVFFVPYVCLEIPANYCLKLLKPHVWLSICLICFGAVSIGQGFVKNYHQLIVTRVLLGALETSMFPSSFYLLGSWYTRAEAQKRYSFFFSSTSLAGAFGGLIAYGMHTLDGKRGIQGWRWIFILEGAITCFCGLILFFLIADFPEDAKFLSENEKAYIKEKLTIDQGDSLAEEKVTLKDIGSVFRDWKLFAAGFMYFGLIVGAYGYAYFSPAIIKTFGFSPVTTQVYSIYPWITTFGMSMITALISDWIRHRYLFTVIGGILSITGYGLLLGTDATVENKHVRYAACFLICVGLYAGMPIMICWCNMNFTGHHRKMVSTAWQVGFGNIGGIISTFVYLQKDAPGYHRGIWTSLALTIFSMASCFTYFIGCFLTNRYRRQGKADAWWSTLSQKEKLKAGDLDPAFRYMY